MSAPKSSNRVLRNNLLGMLAAAVILGLLAPAMGAFSVLLLGQICCVQAFVNFVMGVVYLVKGSKVEESAAPYFLSALLVLLIGLGACSTVFNGYWDKH